MVLFSKKLIRSIEGHDYIASFHNDVYAFKNIPYAKLEGNPEEGLNIFAPPIDIGPEEGKDHWPEPARSTVNSLEPGPISLQTIKHGKANMSGQCQNFNIWVPARALDQGERVPVLFYVHGGSFKNGSNQNSELDGENLVKAQEIIVVEPNYRLGPLGFLDFSPLDSRCGANMAFYDLFSALRWVQKHIAAFGGDPDNVTLMGASSGGTIVSIFPFLDQAKGLFSKLVVLSGIPSAFSPPQEEDERAKRFVDYLGAKDVRQLYQPKMWEKIAEAVEPFTEAIHLGAASYVPLVDKDLIFDNSVALMQETVRAGKRLDIPIWSNMTQDELSIMAVLPKIFGRWGLGELMDQAYVEEGGNQVGTMGDIYNQSYGEDQAPSQVYSDMVIRSVLIWYMQWAAQCTDAYFTRLDWKSPMQKATKLGTFHSSELYLIFNNRSNFTGRTFFQGIGAKNSGRDQVTACMQKDLGRFMREGKLNGPGGKGDLKPFDPKVNLLKAYDVTSSLETVWPKDLDWAWQQTNYYKIVIDEGREEVIENMKNFSL